MDSLSDIASMALSQDGKLLVAVRKNGDVVVWDISSKSRVFETSMKGKNDDSVVMFSPDSKALMCASKRGDLMVWDTSSWASSTVSLGGKYKQLNFELERKALIGLSEEYPMRLTLWEPIAGTKIGTICEVYRYFISRDGKMLATTQPFGTALWSLPSLNQLQLLPKINSNVECLAFSPTADRLQQVVVAKSLFGMHTAPGSRTRKHSWILNLLRSMRHT